MIFARSGQGPKTAGCPVYGDVIVSGVSVPGVSGNRNASIHGYGRIFSAWSGDHVRSPPVFSGLAGIRTPDVPSSGMIKGMIKNKKNFCVARFPGAAQNAFQQQSTIRLKTMQATLSVQTDTHTHARTHARTHAHIHSTTCKTRDRISN